ncbi:hypothetical protein CsSME_00045844 [Camellia sinensis var. sinensis]
MRDQISIFITCVAPLEGYVKLNVDGTAMGNPWLAGFDGIFRDKAGNFKLAFAKTISYITNAMAEMKEVHHRKLELLLLDGLALAQGFEALQLHFVYREANFAADALAKYAVQYTSLDIKINSAPMFLPLFVIGCVQSFSIKIYI